MTISAEKCPPDPKNGPNASLVSFFLAVAFDKISPLIFSHHSIRKLISIFLLAWTIRSYLGST